MIVLIVIGIVAAAVLPTVKQALADARESTALQHLRTIHTSQVSYFSKYGRFAVSMIELGPPPNAGLISGELAKGEKTGYRFTIVAAVDDYAVTARPWPPQASARSFYSDSSLVTRYASGQGEATAESPELGSAKTPVRGQ